MKNRSKLSKLRKRYFKVPNKIHEVGLSAIAIAVYSYLAKMPEDFNPSIGTLAKALNLSKPTALKYLHELKNRNIIKLIKPGGENTISEYELTELTEWT